MRGMVGKLPGSVSGCKMLSSLDLLHEAEAAAGYAARYLREVERPRDPDEWRLKGARAPAEGRRKGARVFVPDVDRTAEHLIAEVLLAADSGARIVGEELAP